MRSHEADRLRQTNFTQLITELDFATVTEVSANAKLSSDTSELLPMQGAVQKSLLRAFAIWALCWCDFDKSVVVFPQIATAMGSYFK